MMHNTDTYFLYQRLWEQTSHPTMSSSSAHQKHIYLTTKSCSGLTEHNQLTTVQRKHLVGEHVGETSKKTRNVIDDARGGTPANR